MASSKKDAARLVFLGTGASGGTPGDGRSRRRESSLLVSNRVNILIDVTRHFAEQSRQVRALDLVLLTHAHRDAAGGLPALRSWWSKRGRTPIPVLASRKTIATLVRAHRRLDHCVFIPVGEGQTHRCGPWRLTPLEVPHAPRQYPTYAWKLQSGGGTIVYASDVACLSRRLRLFCRGASVLIIDGAMWRRKLFSHLTIDEALPVLATWAVREIIVTQIGRTAPSHAQLTRRVHRLCARARPAYDGMRLILGDK